jgi:mRNA interferase MazF
LSDERLHAARRIVIAVPLTSRERPWPTRVRLAAGSYAVAEQPLTMSVNRIAKVERTGHDTTAAVQVINRLIAPAPSKSAPLAGP